MVPYHLKIPPCGPSVYTDSDLNLHYFYFESRDDNCWPVADPCGKTQQNHLKNVVDPGGWLYLK